MENIGNLPVVDLVGGMHHYLPGISNNLILAYCQMHDTFTSENETDEGLMTYMFQLVDDILVTSLQQNDPRLLAISQVDGMSVEDIYEGLTDTFLEERKTKSVADIRRMLQRMCDIEERILRDHGVITGSENLAN